VLYLETSIQIYSYHLLNPGTIRNCSIFRTGPTTVQCKLEIENYNVNLNTNTNHYVLYFHSKRDRRIQLETAACDENWNNITGVVRVAESSLKQRHSEFCMLCTRF
jgi:hypothetical protein